MKAVILLIFLNTFLFSETLSFGAISTVSRVIMEKKLSPLMEYISKSILKDLKFETGFDYDDTIEKFRNGEYDLGFIGPSPYIIAVENMKKPLKIIVGLKNRQNGHFYSVIVVRKDSKIKKIEDLYDKTFAFGSPRSTLSYFMPMSILKESHMDTQLARAVFLGKHDKVAKYVIMGKYDAGGIKASVANRYGKYLRVIKKSRLVPDFVVVASADMPDEMVNKIREALLKPEAQKLAKCIKPSAIGFMIRKRSDYEELRKIMLKIDPDALK